MPRKNPLYNGLTPNPVMSSFDLEAPKKQKIVRTYQSACARAMRLSVTSAYYGSDFGWKAQCQKAVVFLFNVVRDYQSLMVELQNRRFLFGKRPSDKWEVPYHRARGCPLASCELHKWNKPCGVTRLCPNCFMRTAGRSSALAIQSAFFHEVLHDTHTDMKRLHRADDWRLAAITDNYRAPYTMAGEHVVMKGYEYFTRVCKSFSRKMVPASGHYMMIDALPNNWWVSIRHVVCLPNEAVRTPEELIGIDPLGKLTTFSFDYPTHKKQIMYASAFFARYPAGLLKIGPDKVMELFEGYKQIHGKDCLRWKGVFSKWTKRYVAYNGQFSDE